MTLVLTSIAPEFIVQVSDRRLTYPDGRLANDQMNKAVFFYGRIFFAYTGLAKIRSVDTHIWLAEALNRAKASGSTGGVLQLLTKEASQAFQAIPGRTIKRHAFVAAGWAAFPDARDQLRPFISTISNALDSNGSWLPEARRKFELVARPLQAGEAFYFVAHGQPLTAIEAASIRRNLRRALVRRGGPSSVARLMATLLRAVAERNSAVGKNMLISVLPRGAVGNQSALMPLPGREELPFPRLSQIGDNAVCLNVPEDSSSPIRYGPTVVTEHMLQSFAVVGECCGLCSPA